MVENIARQSAKLPRAKQHEVLRFVDSLNAAGRKTKNGASVKAPRDLHPALKGSFGIWTERKDLPAASVEARREMRRRSTERRRNG